MKVFDANGKLVNVDVRQSSYPVRGISKSKLQGLVGEKLQEFYPNQVILEEFTVPGSKLSVDFFLPKLGLVIEIDGIQHQEFSPFFHGDKRTSTKYVNQIRRDGVKESWAENNGYDFVRITTEEDIEQLCPTNN